VAAYQSDHIRFLPKLQNALESQDEQRKLTRTILQALTQICGPISFTLFAKVCHCLLLAKLYVKAQQKSQEIDQSVPLRAGLVEQSKLNRMPF